MTVETNQKQERIQRAEKAIADAKYLGGSEIDCGISDLLTDVMHCCDGHSLDFYSLVDRARANYELECVEDD